MFWKRKPTVFMSAGDAWLLGVLSPLLEAVGMPNEQLFVADDHDDFLVLLEELDRGTREDILADVVFRIFKGERSDIAAFQRANATRVQSDPVVYDLLMGLLMCRAAWNARLLESEEAYALMFCYARRLQVLFATWRDFVVVFSEIFVLHRELIGQTVPEIALAKQAIYAKASALLQPDGLWQKIPWKLSLPENGETELEVIRAKYLTNALFYRAESAFIASSYHWCLAVAAIYRAWWGEAVDSLEPAEFMQHMLDRDWGVTNRRELLEVLRGVFLDRHRPELEAMQQQPLQNLIAWDLVRFMQLATSGVCMGLLTVAEAHDLMLIAAQPLQAAYSDWRDMLMAFKTGRNLWQIYAGQTPEDIGTTNEELDQLLELLQYSPASPLQKIPWQYPLESVSAESEFANFATAPKVQWWHEPNINKKY